MNILPQPNGTGRGGCLPCAGTSFGQTSPAPCPQGVVPGPQGEPGTDGAPGVGVNAFTLTNAAFTMPAPSTSVVVVVGDTLWMSVGQVIFVRSAGFFLIDGIPDGTDVSLNNLGYDTNAAEGTVIASMQPVVPGGFEGPAGEMGGGVTSVGLSLPSIFAVTGSPVTGTGTFAATFQSQTANQVFVAPNGSAGTPTFRSLLLADLPAIPYSAVTLTTTKGDIIVRGASADTRLAVGANGTLLTADSTQTNGLSWQAPAVALITTRRRVSVTPDTMLSTDSIIGISVASAVTETLLASPANGRVITVKDESGAAVTHNITINAGAGDTIEGAAGVVISTNYGYRQFYYDATDKIWFVKASA